jgi:hypothetical protein
MCDYVSAYALLLKDGTVHFLSSATLDSHSDARHDWTNFIEHLRDKDEIMAEAEVEYLVSEIILDRSEITVDGETRQAFIGYMKENFKNHIQFAIHCMRNRQSMDMPVYPSVKMFAQKSVGCMAQTLEYMCDPILDKLGKMNYDCKDMHNAKFMRKTNRLGFYAIQKIVKMAGCNYETLNHENFIMFARLKGNYERVEQKYYSSLIGSDVEANYRCIKDALKLARIMAQQVPALGRHDILANLIQQASKIQPDTEFANSQRRLITKHLISELNIYELELSVENQTTESVV